MMEPRLNSRSSPCKEILDRNAAEANFRLARRLLKFCAMQYLCKYISGALNHGDQSKLTGLHSETRIMLIFTLMLEPSRSRLMSVETRRCERALATLRSVCVTPNEHIAYRDEKVKRNVEIR